MNKGDLNILATNVNTSYRDKYDYFNNICNYLLEKNYVKEEYLEKIIEREEKYPTGLQLDTMSIAIPHSEYIYSNTTGICISTLSEPIKFNLMDDPEKSVDVNIIIQILVDSAEKQVEMLQTLMELITNEQFLYEIKSVSNSEDIIKLFKE